VGAVGSGSCGQLELWAVAAVGSGSCSAAGDGLLQAMVCCRRRSATGDGLLQAMVCYTRWSAAGDGLLRAIVCYDGGAADEGTGGCCYGCSFPFHRLSSQTWCRRQWMVQEAVDGAGCRKQWTVQEAMSSERVHTREQLPPA
jgi:hypothetical protein